MPCETYTRMLNIHRYIPPLYYPYNKYNRFYPQHVHYNTVHSACFFFCMGYIFPFDLARREFVAWFDSAVDSAVDLQFGSMGSSESVVECDAVACSVVEFDLLSINALLFYSVFSSCVDTFSLDHAYPSVYNVAPFHVEIILVQINLKNTYYYLE